jgi:glycosyltransferase involved in cell wall biosynthesis
VEVRPVEENGDGTVVSVIIAVLNGAETIQRCLDSVKSQRGVVTELIVIDGGSTDGTQEILEANGGAIAHWESEPDRGVYHAWNKALPRAAGAWVCFLGADDRLLGEETLHELVDAGEAAGADLVCSRVSYREEDRVVGQPWDWSKMTAFMCVAHPGLLHRRRLFDQFGPFAEDFRITGDYEFLLRLGSDVQSAFVDRATVEVGGSGLSSHGLATLREARVVQSRHPEIGPLRAWLNYAMCLVERVMWWTIDRLPFAIPKNAAFRAVGRLLGLHRHDYELSSPATNTAISDE